MAFKVYTKIQECGIAEDHPESGMMEYGYGKYVNAFIVDAEWIFPGIIGADGEMGMYATERISRDASQATISKARRRARERARYRYARELAGL